MNNKNELQEVVMYLKNIYNTLLFIAGGVIAIAMLIFDLGG